MATMPTRISQDLFESARAAGEASSRSAAQQLDYWARLGRELEASPGMTVGEIARILTGEVAYDDVAGGDQAVARVAWQQQIRERAAALDLSDELAAAGRPWPEADADGNVVMRGADAAA